MDVVDSIVSENTLGTESRGKTLRRYWSFRRTGMSHGTTRTLPGEHGTYGEFDTGEAV